MKFTLSNLKKHLKTNATPAQIAEKLTDLGLEVEDIEDGQKKFANIIVADIIEASQHPNADRLKVCTVFDGTKNLQIVCGGVNARKGIRVILALPGAIIPSSGDTLKVGKVRDVESFGMLCSNDELGLDGESAGIIEFEGNNPAGTPFAQAYGFDDVIIEIAITPNRADCLSVYGIARDLAAGGLGELTPIAEASIKTDAKSPIGVSIETSAKDACLHFSGRLIKGVKNGPSPAWLKNRLESVGMKSISALVDVTNFILHEFGRPLHVFDVDKIDGNIHVRFAKKGEKISALNEQEYALNEDILVVADNSSPLAVAGVIGGLPSSCTLDTINVFLESALFKAINVAKSGRLLNILTDSRTRFERYVDPNFVLNGLDLATQLILELCGGEVCEKVEAGQTPIPKDPIILRRSHLKSLTNLDVPNAPEILKKLGFEILESSWNNAFNETDFIKAAAPSYRQDIHGSADVIEEVLRIHGLAHLKEEPLPKVEHQSAELFTPNQLRARKLRMLFAQRGLTESLNWSFVNKEHALLFQDNLDAITLTNPISQDLSVMRPNLLINLLISAQRNFKRSHKTICLFEVGNSYNGTSLKDQKLVAAGIRSGTKRSKSWNENESNFDTFDIKADLWHALSYLGINPDNLQITHDVPSWYHPGKSASICMGPKNVIARFGQIHPSYTKAFDVDDDVFAFEIFLDALPQKNSPAKKGGLALSNLQNVERDFAFILDENVSAQSLIRAILKADANLITSVKIFDVYQGENLEAGKKSVAVRVLLTPQQQTLSEKDLTQISTKIIEQVSTHTKGALRQ